MRRCVQLAVFLSACATSGGAVGLHRVAKHGELDMATATPGIVMDAYHPQQIVYEETGQQGTFPSLQARLFPRSGAAEARGVFVDSGSSGLLLCPGMVDVEEAKGIRALGKRGCGWESSGPLYHADALFFEAQGGGEIKVENVTFMLIDKSTRFCKSEPPLALGAGIFGIARNLPGQSYLSVCNTTEAVDAPLGSVDQVGISWPSGSFESGAATLLLGAAAMEPVIAAGASALEAPIASRCLTSSWTANFTDLFIANKPMEWPPWDSCARSAAIFDTGTPFWGLSETVLQRLINFTSPYEVLADSVQLTLGASGNLSFGSLAPTLRINNTLGMVGGALDALMLGLPAFQDYYIMIDYAAGVMRFAPSGAPQPAASKAYANFETFVGIPGFPPAPSPGTSMPLA